MIEYIKLKPDSFSTRYLRAENRQIIRTEKGDRIILDRIIPSDWTPLRVYEYEKQLNDNKREINLVERIYRDQIVREYRRLMQE